MNVKDKFSRLREQLQVHGLDGYVQPVHDEYQSEYPPECARRVAWLTGFSGSAGMAAILVRKAALFVDGRYTLQAAREVDAALCAVLNSGDMQPEAWLAVEAPGARIGYDPRLLTRRAAVRMEQALSASGVSLVAVQQNLVDVIWQDRPASPCGKVFVHALSDAGEPHEAKRARVGADVAKAGADVALLLAPDGIMWLLNIRGADIAHAPLALCSALIDREGRTRLYIDPAKISDTIRKHLGGDVTVLACEALEEDLGCLGAQGKTVLIDPANAPMSIWRRLAGAGAASKEAPDPCALMKAVKNTVEIEGMRRAHVRDGVAVVRLLAWLDGETGRRAVEELEVVEKLLHFRAQSPLFQQPSFDTISGSGPNGAIVHYRATQDTNRALRHGELFLLDSGGQYPDGTTDITRTVAIGDPSAQHKDRFTRVLKGHIALATAVFPQGTAGSQLDSLARRALWDAALDYDHGTGHGVGHFLSVHEGPQRISKRAGDAPLAPGMIVSNEPGYYKAGEYGIRIENLIVVEEKRRGEDGRAYCGFETITCVPIDTRLVEPAMLADAEIAWLNAYHAWVLAQLSPYLGEAENVWLAERCRALYPHPSSRVGMGIPKPTPKG